MAGILDDLYAQGLDFLLKQAAEWSRIPTRLRRVEAARVIVAQAAGQRGKNNVVDVMRTTGQALQQVQRLYDSGSGKIADVVDRYRAVPQGSLPPISLAPKAAEVAAMVASTTAALTEVERQVNASGAQVLTPEEHAKLLSGTSFPAFIGNQAKTWIKYAVFGAGIYFAIKAFSRSGGTRSW